MQITAANTYTAPVKIRGDEGYDVAVTGTFSATVTVEMSKDGENGWVPAGTTEDPAILTAYPATAWWVRAGVASGDYTSGTVEVEVYS